MDDPMETVLDAGTRLRAAGFTTDLSAAPRGRLRCPACGATVDAARCTVVDIVRFEGDSNPDDEAILVALISPCGHRGQFSCAYGQTIGADAAEVLRALPAHPTTPQGGPLR
jgi:hypothetical protein